MVAPTLYLDLRLKKQVFQGATQAGDDGVLRVRRGHCRGCNTEIRSLFNSNLELGIAGSTWVRLNITDVSNACDVHNESFKA